MGLKREKTPETETDTVDRSLQEARSLQLSALKNNKKILTLLRRLNHRRLEQVVNFQSHFFPGSDSPLFRLL